MVPNSLPPRLLGLTAALALLPLPAHAYIGPGAGLGAIAVTVAVVLGLILLLVGFVWYPLKRLLKSKKPTDDAVKDRSPE